jgi:hypothetical protein
LTSRRLAAISHGESALSKERWESALKLVAKLL